MSAKCQKPTSLTISIFALCLAQGVRQQGPWVLLRTPPWAESDAPGVALGSDRLS